MNVRHVGYIDNEMHEYRTVHRGSMCISDIGKICQFVSLSDELPRFAIIQNTCSSIFFVDLVSFYIYHKYRLDSVLSFKGT